MKLRINPLVAVDLKEIKDFFAEDNEGKALETIQEIYRQFENIQQFPYKEGGGGMIVVWYRLRWVLRLWEQSVY